MLFSSLIFLYAFLPCTFLIYFLTPKKGKMWYCSWPACYSMLGENQNI